MVGMSWLHHTQISSAVGPDECQPAGDPNHDPGSPAGHTVECGGCGGEIVRADWDITMVWMAPDRVAVACHAICYFTLDAAVRGVA